MKVISPRLILMADLAGTFVFALEGALIAIQNNFDFLGVMVLAFTAALGGGVIRDILIGAHPPNAIRDWRYATVAFVAGTLAFLLYAPLLLFPNPILITLDAAGLSLFAVSGTEKSIAYKIHPFIAVLMGTLTGVGGGILRDIFLAQVPAIFRTDIYATAALAGASVMVIGQSFGMPRRIMAITGGLMCFSLRLIAVWQNWHLPTATSFNLGL